MLSIRYRLTRGQGLCEVMVGLALALLAPASASAEDMRTQRDYLEFLCRQAGLSASAERVACEELRSAQARTALVQAGLNDIDRRCDAYLAWIDDQKRFGRVTEDRDAAAVRTMAAAGAALGVKQSVFARHIRSASTAKAVQSAVLAGQQRYRANLPATIRDGPAAIEIIRGYLLICSPAAIDAELRQSKP
jgi:hypothetical protein